MFHSDFNIDVFNDETITVKNHIRSIKKYGPFNVSYPRCHTFFSKENSKRIDRNYSKSCIIFQVLIDLGYKQTLFWKLYFRYKEIKSKYFYIKRSALNDSLRYVSGLNIKTVSKSRMKLNWFYDNKIKPIIIIPKCLYVTYTDTRKSKN